MARLGERREVAHPAEEFGVLHDDAGGLPVDPFDEPLGPVEIRFQAVEFGGKEFEPGFRHLAVVGVEPAGHQHAPPPGDPERHVDRLQAGGGAVIHRRIGDIEAGDQRDLGLELEQRLQGSLRYLRLVGRIRGEELAPLDQRVHARRNVVAIGAGTEEERRAAGGKVACGERSERALDLDLAGVIGQVEYRVAGRLGHVAEQAVDGRCADRGEHRPPVGIG